MKESGNNSILSSKEELYSSDEAVFSAQYRRKLFIKHFLLTKRGAGILILMFFLYFNGLLHVYISILLIMLLVAFYLKNKDLSFERDKTLWLLIARKRFIERLEQEKKDDDEKKSKGEFIKDFFTKKEKDGIDE